MIKPAVLGVGYLGPKLVRNIKKLPDVNLAGNCDLSPIAREYIRERYPYVPLFTDFKMMMEKYRPDAILIATPAHNHFTLIKNALHHNLYLIKKSLTMISRNVRELIILADDSNLTLMNWHTFLYSNYLREVRKYIGAHDLSDEWLCDTEHKKQISKIKNEVYYD